MLLDHLDLVLVIAAAGSEDEREPLPDEVSDRLSFMPVHRAPAELRLSQTTVASQLGISRQAVSGAESGKRAITVEELLKLSNLYRVPIEAFLRPKSPPSRYKLERIQRRENVKRSELLDDHDTNEIAAFIEFLESQPRGAGRLRIRQMALRAAEIRKDQGPFRQLTKIADRVRVEADLKAPPINVYRAFSCFALRMRMTGLNTISGAFIPGGEARPPGVLINSNQPSDRQRFSAAHELGHYILGHATSGDQEIVSPLGRRFSPTEVEADSFASEFLMPTSLVLQEINRLPGSSGLEAQVYMLADRVLVSFQAIVYRLANLNVITPSQKEALLKVRPSEVEATLKLKAGSRKRSFDPMTLNRICGSSFPPNLLQRADGVRQLQELAFEEYARQVSEAERADSAGSVYEKVAVWVSKTYPLHANLSSAFRPSPR